MMRSLYAAISGLRNHQIKMDVIGNNIANVNTVGFKSGSVTFQDMLSQTLAGASSGNGTTGGTNPMQVGLGVSTAAISTNFTDGSAQSTGSQTDLAISGQGFFVLGDPLNQVYSRAGNFTFDTSGNLVVPGTGMKVLGWQGDSSGVVSTTGPISGIQIPVGSSMPAKVSSTLTMKGNLSASANAYGGTTVAASTSAITATTSAIAAQGSIAAAKTAATTVVGTLLPADAVLAQTAANQAVTDATQAVSDALTAKSNATPSTLAAATTAYADAQKMLADALLLQTAANNTVATTNIANATAAQTAANKAATSANTAVASAQLSLPAVMRATVQTVADMAGTAVAPAFSAGSALADAQAAVTAAVGAANVAATTLYQTSLVTARTSADAAKAAAAAYPGTTTAATVQTAAAKAVADAQTAVDNATAAAAVTGADVTTTAAALTSAKKVLADAKAANVAAVALTDHTSDQPASINVYDNQGNAYKLNGTFEKIGANQWSFTPTSTVTDASGVTVGNVTTSVNPIVLAFNANGTYNSAGSTVGTIKIDPTTVTPPSPYLGAGAFNMTPDFSTMTQYGTDTTAKMDSTDGYTAGTLTAGGGITISSDGTIVGTFTNGKKMNLAKIAMATFNNPGGLMKEGNSLYAASSNSGTPNVGTAGTGGRGTFTPGSLEMSNVDLAQQFSDMIVTQRGFQANSKIITTDDSMLEELVNLKR